MLATDGAGIFAAFTVAQHYQDHEGKVAVYIIYWFFLILTAVFVALTISDTLVIFRMPPEWATLPIIRGLAFRVPLTVYALYMIHKQHGR